MTFNDGTDTGKPVNAFRLRTAMGVNQILGPATINNNASSSVFMTQSGTGSSCATNCKQERANARYKTRLRVNPNPDERI